MASKHSSKARAIAARIIKLKTVPGFVVDTNGERIIVLQQARRLRMAGRIEFSVTTPSREDGRWNVVAVEA